MESAKTLVINIVTWNSARYLPNLFASLDAQTNTDFTVTAVDNASTDETLRWFTERRQGVALLRNFRNLGFARAHNQAIALALSRWEEADLTRRYVMVANPDLEYAPDAVAKLIAFMDAHPDVAACGPKLLRAIPMKDADDGRHETERTRIIDAAGIALTRARRPFDRGAGEEDKGQYDTDTRVFGLSGACAVYRASALAEAKCAGDFFDEDFFAYQEDVDLAWRMRLLGMESRLVPEAVVWHHRRAPSNPRAGWFAAWKHRRRKSPYINFYSTRNHGWLLVKNDQLANSLLHAPWWVPYEVAKCLAGLFSLSQMKGELASFQGLPKMQKKRKELMKRARVSAAEMRAWFVS